MRAEAVSNRGPSAYQPNALPLGQTGSQQVAIRTAYYSMEPQRTIVTTEPPPVQDLCITIRTKASFLWNQHRHEKSFRLTPSLYNYQSEFPDHTKRNQYPSSLGYITVRMLQCRTERTVLYSGLPFMHLQTRYLQQYRLCHSVLNRFPSAMFCVQITMHSKSIS